MAEYKKTKLILTTTILAASFLVFIWSIASARAATSTLRGAALWSSDRQYLYFNCLDDVIGDRLDVPQNLCGGNADNGYTCAEPPDNVFHLYSPPCVGLVHGVYINNDGNFSGSAWNDHLGLVTFDATTTPPEDGYGFNSHCPHTCNLSNNCWACYNENDQKVYGWARVVGDGTWIRLNSATTTPVQIQGWNAENSASSTLPGHGIQPGDFVGYGTTTDQALSFNCESEWNGAEIGNCDNRDYKVYISNLQIGHLSAPNWSYSQACTPGAARTAVLKWYLKSGTQTAYRLIFNTSNSTSTPVFDSGKISGSARQLICPGPLCAWTPNYATNYYWWIQLWDEDDAATEFYQYGTDDGHSGTLDEATEGNPDSNIKTFTTYSHEFPNPFFTWEPYDVLIATSTDFTSNYPSGTPLPQSCYDACSYLWTTSDPNDIISASTSPTTTIKFFHATTTVVYFRVTDASTYYCSTSTALHINYDLPIWREVKAE